MLDISVPIMASKSCKLGDPFIKGILTGQQADEVSLQHRFEVEVDVSVLVVAHACEQVLDELHLVGLAPALEIREACLPLRRVLRRGLFLPRRVVQYGHGVLQIKQTVH